MLYRPYYTTRDIQSNSKKPLLVDNKLKCECPHNIFYTGALQDLHTAFRWYFISMEQCRSQPIKDIQIDNN